MGKSDSMPHDNEPANLSRRSFISKTLELFASSLTLSRLGLVGGAPKNHLSQAQSTIQSSSQSASQLTSNWTPIANVGATKFQPFAYGIIKLNDCAAKKQCDDTLETLLAIGDDTMLKPYRVRAGVDAPGVGLGGWYDENSNYDWHSENTSAGFAPGHCFGQWLSALARAFAITGDVRFQQKLERLLTEYGKVIAPRFYENFRFPAYTYDKLVIGLLDSYKYGKIDSARELLARTTNAALPSLPKAALERGKPLPEHPERDESFRWDESYTLPEYLFAAYQSGAGPRYKTMAESFMLNKEFFEPLARNENVLPGRHAYSHANALSSAAVAYLVSGDEKNLRAAVNGFEMIKAQSYATGGWGPDETFIVPGSDGLFASLQKTHNTFETCGILAQIKLCRYLLCITGDAKYGDSIDQIIQNAALGVKPMLADGSAFYYADYNLKGNKKYYRAKCPCCAGSLPQIVSEYSNCCYFVTGDGLVVNLFMLSSVEWQRDGARLRVDQSTEYPNAESVILKLSCSKPREFAIDLRIPEWAAGATLMVNGVAIADCATNTKSPDVNDAATNGATVNGATMNTAATDHTSKLTPGTFATIRRVWHDGDRLEMQLPMKAALVAIDATHPEIAALKIGPLALFALLDSAESSPLKLSRADLLMRIAPATNPKTGNREWVLGRPGLTPVRFVPFSSIADETYSAYFSLES